MSLCLLGACPNKDESIFGRVIKTQVVFSSKIMKTHFFKLFVEQLDIDFVSCDTNKMITHFFFFLLIVRWPRTDTREAKRGSSETLK